MPFVINTDTHELRDQSFQGFSMMRNLHAPTPEIHRLVTQKDTEQLQWRKGIHRKRLRKGLLPCLGKGLEKSLWM